MGYLGYKSLLELPKLTSGIKVKGPVPTKICSRCMKSHLQQKPSRTLIIKTIEILKKIQSDLGELLSSICWVEQYYISCYDIATRAYYVKTMWYKSQAFEKFLEFISWVENKSGEKLKKYCTDKKKKFDKEALKSWCLEHRVLWDPNASYTLEQNRKAERLNYTLMSSLCLIMAAIKLPKSLWGKILKMVTYLKNCNLSQKKVTHMKEQMKKNRIWSICVFLVLELG